MQGRIQIVCGLQKFSGGDKADDRSAARICAQKSDGGSGAGLLFLPGKGD